MSMMKGFAATPVIFIAIILITATLFLHFSEMDKTVADGILKEAEGSKAAADAMKIENVNSSAIYLRTRSLLDQYGNLNDTIKDELENDFNPMEFTVDNTTINNKIIVTYTLNTSAANLNKTQTYSEVIPV